jgi:hypothetical protein
MIVSWLMIGFVFAAIFSSGCQRKVAATIALCVVLHAIFDMLVPDTYLIRFGLAATVDSFLVVYLLRHIGEHNDSIVDMAILFFISMVINIGVGLTDEFGFDVYEIYKSFSVIQHTMILIMVFFGADNGRDSAVCKLVDLFNRSIGLRVQKAEK